MSLGPKPSIVRIFTDPLYVNFLLSCSARFFEVISLFHAIANKVVNPQHIAFLQGGLANQLLQAALISTEERIPVGKLDVSDCLFNSRLRSFRAVTRRGISQLFSSQVVMFPGYRQISSRIRLRIPLFRETLFDGALHRTHTCGKRVYKGDGLTPNVFSSEYNQYWISILDQLDCMFGICSSPPSVSVHVRWGDYCTVKTQMNSGLYPLPRAYFLSALAVLRASGADLSEACFFSDSPAQVQQAFKGSLNTPIRVSHARSPEEDLWMMSYSPRLILSNSTLSCVAAHLSKMRQNCVEVFAPSRWFLRDGLSSRLDLRQTGWMLI
jgi:hypothetical protein